ncbi:MAG: RecQ family ATP-dependent DNA helicase [Gloeomargarita sp. SKYBB_i_bin120]|nr:RecQ family ATP-dependent DNA helicase [Gloeomargarita sp. SKYB120]MDW8177711.1 RecQ family ATP-dependent DNA helicase [Gloeomargarita sp. SKYBB_i_bin120]
MFTLAEARAKFQEIWGYPDFRPPQGEIIQCLLEGRDALIVLPTGFGKSICFQLPALLQDGVTLVISPLIALMEDQVQALVTKKLKAATIHSQQLPAQRRATLRALQSNELRLLYLAPETLLSPPVWEVLTQPEVAIRGLILDEAHCLAQWGDNFRPAYERLGAVRPSLLRHKPPGTRIPLAAFTATADPPVQETIQRVLRLEDPVVVRRSPYRQNINITVHTVLTPYQRRQKVLEFIRAREGEAGLVYVATRRDTEVWADWLRTKGIPTHAYHAGLSATERRELEQLWLKGGVPFLVSTSALGMGVNKPDIRWVMHIQPPFNPLDYIQGIGRGGRDGALSEAITLTSQPTGWWGRLPVGWLFNWLNPIEAKAQKHYLSQLQKQYDEALKAAHTLPPQGRLDQLPDPTQAAAALALLHRVGVLHWEDPYTYRLDKKRLAQLRVRPQDAGLKAINAYLRTSECRWLFLVRALGLEQEGDPLPCGHCDNCWRTGRHLRRSIG